MFPNWRLKWKKFTTALPPGSDNTVISYAMPVYYVRGQPLETLRLPEPFVIVIGDTGLPSPTALAVGELCGDWQMDQDKYEAIFDSVAGIVKEARATIENGNMGALWCSHESKPRIPAPDGCLITRD